MSFVTYWIPRVGSSTLLEIPWVVSLCTATAEATGLEVLFIRLTLAVTPWIDCAELRAAHWIAWIRAPRCSVALAVRVAEAFISDATLVGERKSIRIVT